MDNNFIDKLGVCFAFSGEAVKGSGEDAYIYSFNENRGLIGVFDGCGGLGSRRYQQLESRSGAYIASRIAAETAASWFDEYGAASLKKRLDDTLSLFNGNTSSSRIKGAMTKSFPTTAALALLYAHGGGLHADFIWAGDSRGYILSGGGLTQITRDDIDSGIDAFDNISSDGVLTNVISAGGDYVLHSRKTELDDKCIVFAATDGCFGYLRSPMDFEYVILSTMLAAGSVNEWKRFLAEEIRKYAGDDYTLSLAALGFGSFGEMKKHYTKRFDFVYGRYINGAEKYSDEEMLSLWNEYKINYYGGAKGK